VNSIQHYLTKFVCNLLQVGAFPFANKTDHHDITEILLKVALSTIPPNSTVWYFVHHCITPYFFLSWELCFYDLWKMDKIMHSIITNISLFTCVGCFYYLTRIYQHNKWKKLFIWIYWFVLVDIGILIYTGLNPVQIRIPISTRGNWNSNLY
jgi:hypothetical protein